MYKRGPSRGLFYFVQRFGRLSLGYPLAKWYNYGMKLVILYRPLSAHGRKTEEFIHEYQRVYPGSKVEVIEIDTREGMAMASLYDIMQYPAILALRDNGSLADCWQGDTFPLMQEVLANVRS